MIAWVTALGGGIVRDVLLGDLPPVGISDRGLVLTALMSGLVVAIVHPEIDRLQRPLIVFDALSLGLFAVNGTSKALAWHTSGMTAVFLGMFTTLAGGLIRDTLLNEVPSIIRDKHWYAVPSFIGCVLTVFVDRAALRDLIGQDVQASLNVLIVIVVVAMRLLSVHYDVKVPGAWQREPIHPRTEFRYIQVKLHEAASRQAKPGRAAGHRSAEAAPSTDRQPQPGEPSTVLRQKKPRQ